MRGFWGTLWGVPPFFVAMALRVVPRCDWKSIDDVCDVLNLFFPFFFVKKKILCHRLDDGKKCRIREIERNREEKRISEIHRDNE